MDVLIPRPYGIVGMIGEMISEGQIPALKESIGLILSRKLSTTARPHYRISSGSSQSAASVSTAPMRVPRLLWLV
jgi:hypothetical protein